MSKKKGLHIYLLNMILIVLAVFCVLAFYLSWNAQQTYQEDTSQATADYDYETIQELVELPVPSAPLDSAASYTAPYVTEEMMSINGDFKGWLWIPDSYVNYPVVQSTDNNTYLYRSFQGEHSSFGSLFLDMDSALGSQNRVIHGHNMGNNRTEMFSCLINYQNQEWADERIYAYFTEPDDMQNNTYQLFAVLNFNVNDLDEFNYLQTDFDTEAERLFFLDYLKNRSLYETDFYPSGDTLILSTCNRAKGGADNRLLVCFGRVNTKTDMESTPHG